MGLNIELNNRSADGFNNDQIYPMRYRTSEFGGTDPTFQVPLTPTFPNSRSGTPTRYIIEFPGSIYTVDLTTYPVILKSGATILTRVLGVPSANEYRIVINTSSTKKTQIEFAVDNTGQEIHYDLWVDESVMVSDENGNINVKNINSSNITTENLSVSNQGFIIFEHREALNVPGGYGTSSTNWYQRKVTNKPVDTNNHGSLILPINYTAITGTFVIGDIVEGVTSGATAEVVYVSGGVPPNSGVLYCINVNGTFTDTEDITNNTGVTGTNFSATTLDLYKMFIKAGTYKISSEVYGRGLGLIKSAIRDFINSTYLYYGESAYSGAAGSTSYAHSKINTVLTFNNDSIIEIHFRSTGAPGTSTSELGTPTNTGTHETYITIELHKLS